VAHFPGLSGNGGAKQDLAPRARFELATLRLTAKMIENLTALSGVAYEKLGAIFPFLAAPTPTPTRDVRIPVRHAACPSLKPWGPDHIYLLRFVVGSLQHSRGTLF